MQHTLVAVFGNRSDAQHAMNALVSSGFAPEDVQLSDADPTGMTDSTTGSGQEATPAGGALAGSAANLRRVFTDLFGADNSIRASKYAGAVTRGHHVLTVHADSLAQAERAADIVERFGPTDIDQGMPDTVAAGLDTGGPSDAVRTSSPGSMQQAAPAPAQPRAVPRAASRPHLDNPGNLSLFQQHSLSRSEPAGGTYQEPMGQSGLGATGSTSLHGSILRDNAAHIPTLEDSMIETTRGQSRIYSPLPTDATGHVGGLAIGSSFFGDDDYYRNHFLANYGSEDDGAARGATEADYDKLRPAYSFGAEMRRSEMFRNRPWDDVEGDLTRAWHARAATEAEGGAGSGRGSDSVAGLHGAWDRVKAAVRHGWERIRS